jgi:Mg2+ and Co2+ transporter CorA
MAQLADNRKSMVEAGRIMQLTYIAVVFVPLSFVAAIFSMAEEYIPGKPGFRIYLVSALLLMLLVLAVSILLGRIKTAILKNGVK